MSAPGVVGLAAALLAIPAAARAAETPGPSVVRVVTPACDLPPLSIAAFVGALRVELAGSVIRCCAPETSATPDRARVEVTLHIEPCDPNARSVGISVRDGATGRAPNGRTVGLEDVPMQARPRTVALAAAELVRAFGESTHPEQGGRLPAAPVPQAPRAQTALVWGAAAELRLFPARHTSLWGARLSLAVATERWQIEVDVDGATGSARRDPGTIVVRALSAGVAAGPRWRRGGTSVSLALCADAGQAWIAGEAAGPAVTAGSGSGTIATAGARASIESQVAGPLYIQALVQAGAVASGVTANVDGVAASGIAGPYVLLALGAVLAPSR